MRKENPRPSPPEPAVDAGGVLRAAAGAREKRIEPSTVGGEALASQRVAMTGDERLEFHVRHPRERLLPAFGTGGVEERNGERDQVAGDERLRFLIEDPEDVAA